jgi:hypothetical protein
VKEQSYNDMLEHVQIFLVSNEREDRTKNIVQKYICFLLSIVYMTRFRGEVSEGEGIDKGQE